MRTMQHRHLDSAHFSTAAVASILERGGASDLRALLSALKRDPHGAVADAALRAAQASEVYGYPELLRVCVQAWRNRQPMTSTGSD